MDVLKECLLKVREITEFTPRVAMVLGSGLGHFTDEITPHAEIPFSRLPGFPVSTVQGHRGRFILGFLGEVPVIAMQGRVHYYEGYSMEEVVLPIRLMHLLGAEILFLTNAAGGIREDLVPGTLMAICDHIASFVPSPLRGKNKEDLGVRFPDMSRVYSERLMEVLRQRAKELSLPLREGVYLQAAGPAYETPAEIRAYRALGADCVGMSTACEAMAAHHAGMEVAGISCISNRAAGLGNAPLSHGEVQETAKKVAADFSALLIKTILSLEA